MEKSVGDGYPVNIPDPVIPDKDRRGDAGG